MSLEEEEDEEEGRKEEEEEKSKPAGLSSSLAVRAGPTTWNSGDLLLGHLAKMHPPPHPHPQMQYRIASQYLAAGSGALGLLCHNSPSL